MGKTGAAYRILARKAFGQVHFGHQEGVEEFH
jgi:hypothetical protein